MATITTTKMAPHARRRWWRQVLLGCGIVGPAWWVAMDVVGAALAIETEDCGTFLAGAYPEFIGTSKIGDRATVVIRPEDLALAPEGNGFAATVKDLTFLGECYEVSIEAGDRKLRAKTRKRPATRGGEVVVQADPDAVWAVP